MEWLHVFSLGNPKEEILGIATYILPPLAINFAVARLLLHFSGYQKKHPSFSANAGAALISVLLMVPEMVAWSGTLWGEISIRRLLSETVFTLLLDLPIVLVLGPVCILYFVLARQGIRLLSDVAVYVLCGFCVVLEYFYFGYVFSH